MTKTVTQPKVPPTAEEKRQKREAKKALEQQQREAQEAERKAEEEAFMAKLPMTTFALMARANKRHDVFTRVEGVAGSDDDLLRVDFEFQDRSGNSRDAETVTIYLELWNYNTDSRVNEVVQMLDDLEAADREEARLRQVAIDAYNSLTEDQRKALGVRKPY